MEPSTFAMILSAVGTVGQVISGISSANQRADAAKKEAKMAQQQAAIEEAQQRRHGAQVLGKQKATAEASGIASGSGSALTMLLDSAYQAEMDALNVRYGGERAAWAKKYEARLERQSIPGIAFGGLAQSASIFGDWYSRNKGPLTKKVT